jgi:4-hydroxy-2-oxoheptanedioate aldolase
VAGLTRASGFGTKPDYLAKAHEDICLILQIESRAGLDAVEEIAAIDGVDALFLGPGDLAGALGHLGDSHHPAVQAALSDALRRTQKAGKPSGIFATSPENAKMCAAMGARMISIGTDIGLLSGGARQLRKMVEL